MRVRRLFPLTVLLPALACAHAFLEHAVPAVGATVSSAPSQLRLQFSEEVEPAFCTVALSGPDGTLELPKPQRPAGRSDELVVSLPDLKPGEYQVRWRALSVDTHVTQGRFSFTVGRSP